MRLKHLFAGVLVGLAFQATNVGDVRADNVLLLSTGVTAEDTAVVNLLQADGHTVTVGPVYENYTGTSLAGYTAVILLQNNTGIGGVMPAGGQAELVNYVQSGGGLLTGEWTAWGMGAEHYNQTLAAVMPVIPSAAVSYNYNSPITYTQATPDAVLNNGLPSSFSFAADDNLGTEADFQPQPGATVFYGSNYAGTPPGDGVIGWSYGAGRVLSLSTLAGQTELADPNYGLLFSNAVTWVEPQAAVPEPSTLTLLGIGSIGLAAHAGRRRARSARRSSR